MSHPIDETSHGPASKSAEEIRSYLTNELSKSLEMEPAAIDSAAPLDRLGVDSLMALRMAGGLAEWLGRDVPATLMWDYRTVDAIAKGLATPTLTSRLPAGVVALQPQGDAIPIFGFPGLAGTPLAFASLAAKLGENQLFYGVAVPGFEGVPGSYTSVEEIAAAMLVMIRQARPTGPYRLAGYCFGGLLAYEAARQLVAAGEEVSLLAIFDAFTPAGRVPRPVFQRFFVHLYHLASGRSRLKDVTGKLRWPHLSRRLSKSEPEYWIEPAPEGSDAAKDLWNINSAAAAKYRPGSYAGPIHLFLAAERATYNAFYKMMPCGGWSRCTTGALTTLTIPGNHGNMIGPDHAQTTAEALRTFLPKA